MVTAGIYGASGYMGGEALRILLKHPEVSVKWATSRSNDPIEEFHKNFYGFGLKFIKPEDAYPCDVVFYAVPSGVTASLCGDMLDNGSVIIDYGADFRLKNKNDWEKTYKMKHPNWGFAEKAVYGINELHKKEIKSTKIVANPGCFASSSILGLAPLIREDLIDAQKIIVDGMSGTVGAGNSLDIALHHPEIHNNILPYNVVDHRHTYEIEQELSLIANEEVTVNFSAYYVPISRGILTANHCFPKKKINRRQLIDLYKEYYKDSYFVKILDIPKDNNSTWNYKPYPWISAVSGTNFCHIGIDIDERRNRIVVFRVLDSIGKGGALVGIQNMNIIFGFDEKAGLDFYGMHPY